jgi:hypothetical protein
MCPLMAVSREGALPPPIVCHLVELRALSLDGIRRKRSESHKDWRIREDLSAIHYFTRTLYYGMTKAADSVFYCLFSRRYGWKRFGKYNLV